MPDTSSPVGVRSPRPFGPRVRALTIGVVLVALQPGCGDGSSPSPLVSRLYATNVFVNSVTIFADGAEGDILPVVTIRGPNTGLDHPSGMTITGPSRGTLIP